MENETLNGKPLDLLNGAVILNVTFRELKHAKFIMENISKKENKKFLEVRYMKDAYLPGSPVYSITYNSATVVNSKLFNKILARIEDVLEEPIEVFTHGHFSYS